MLTVTHSAAELLNSLREHERMPEDFVIRVSSNSALNGSGVKISFAPGPAAGDAVIDSEGTTICLDPDLIEPLADAVIDAQQTPHGAELLIRR